MGCDETTIIALFFVAIEAWVRKDSQFERYHGFDDSFWRWKGPCFFLFYILSVFSTICNYYGFHLNSILNHPQVRSNLPYLYLTDSVGALILGYSLYYSHFPSFIFSLIILTNFFLVHIMHSIFAMEKPVSLVRTIKIFYILIII
jgi:hypothetical protein